MAERMFAPVRIDILTNRGQVVSGDYTSLAAKDSNVLVIKSVQKGNYHMIDFVAEFQLPKDQSIRTLSLEITGKYSTFAGQQILLFNFAESKWDSISYKRLGQSIFTLTSPIANPDAYVSTEGKLHVRVYIYNGILVSGFFDCLIVKAEFEELPPPPQTGTLEIKGMAGLAVFAGTVFIGHTPLTREFPPKFQDVTFEAIPVEAGKKTSITIARE